MDINTIIIQERENILDQIEEIAQEIRTYVEDLRSTYRGLIFEVLTKRKNHVTIVIKDPHRPPNFWSVDITTTNTGSLFMNQSGPGYIVNNVGGFDSDFESGKAGLVISYVKKFLVRASALLTYYANKHGQEKSSGN